MRTGQISEYPNLNEIIDPAAVNALYEGEYKQEKDSVPVLCTSIQTETRIQKYVFESGILKY